MKCVSINTFVRLASEGNGRHHFSLKTSYKAKVCSACRYDCERFLLYFYVLSSRVVGNKISKLIWDGRCQCGLSRVCLRKVLSPWPRNSNNFLCSILWGFHFSSLVLKYLEEDLNLLPKLVSPEANLLRKLPIFCISAQPRSQPWGPRLQKDGPFP